MKIKIGLNTHRKNKNIIIIPKKKVKHACDRNKIRRQIRAILAELGIKNTLVKYDDTQRKPLFHELKNELHRKRKQ